MKKLLLVMVAFTIFNIFGAKEEEFIIAPGGPGGFQLDASLVLPALMKKYNPKMLIKKPEQVISPLGVGSTKPVPSVYPHPQLTPGTPAYMGSRNGDRLQNLKVDFNKINMILKEAVEAYSKLGGKSTLHNKIQEVIDYQGKILKVIQKEEQLIKDLIEFVSLNE